MRKCGIMSEDTKKRKPKKEKEKLPPFDEFMDWMKTFAKTMALVLLAFTFIIRTARVDGPSMLPTLEDEQMLLLWSFNYQPKQGDIVAANAPKLGKVIVKRVAAVGGQTVTIDFVAGKVYVDGEEFLVDGIQNITTSWQGADIQNITVPEGKYFVLGDNRQNSKDSRNMEEVGFVDREDILGRCFLRILPFECFGKLS